jgi:hypothetical protein
MGIEQQVKAGEAAGVKASRTAQAITIIHRPSPITTT